MPTPKPFLPHGGSYKNLLVYQKSECIYDVTFYFLTSSLRTPKIFIKEFSYFLMPCHQHCLGVNLLVQR